MSDTWDREIKNIFIVQDEIAAIIAKKVNEDIITNLDKEAPVAENTEAVEYYLNGKYMLGQWNFEHKDDIISNFRKAIELDNKLMHTWVYVMHKPGWQPQEMSILCLINRRLKNKLDRRPAIFTYRHGSIRKYQYNCF